VAASRATIEDACRSFVGELRQVPPAYSAKHVDGRRLHELARAGTPVVSAAAPVVVHSLDVLSVDGDRVRFRLRCSPGTYVRALARDLGEALGVGGHLTALRRTRSGGFGLQDAVHADALTAESRERVVPLRACLVELPAARVTDEGRRAVAHGRVLTSRFLASGLPGADGAPLPGRFRVLDAAGELLALAVPTAVSGAPGAPPSALHPDVVLVD
jgi:tRNA pseudouridine55 synthase